MIGKGDSVTDFSFWTGSAPSLEGLTVEVIAAPPPTAQELILHLHERIRSAASRRERSAQEPIMLGDEVECDLFFTLEDRLVSDSLRYSARLEVQEFPHLPGLLEALLALHPGDNTQFPLTLPSDYPATELAGREVRSYVHIKRAFQIESTELDDPVALQTAGLGDSIEKAMETIAEEIDIEQGEQLLVEATQAVLEALSRRIEVDIPTGLIDDELDMHWNSVAAPIFAEGSPTENLAEQARRDFLACPRLRQEAAQRIKIGLALGAIVKKEELAPDIEVMENLIETASLAAKITPSVAKAALRQQPEDARKATETALYLTAIEFVMARAKVDVIDLPQGLS